MLRSCDVWECEAPSEPLGWLAYFSAWLGRSLALPESHSLVSILLRMARTEPRPPESHSFPTAIPSGSHAYPSV